MPSPLLPLTLVTALAGAALAPAASQARPLPAFVLDTPFAQRAAAPRSPGFPATRGPIPLALQPQPAADHSSTWLGPDPAFWDPWDDPESEENLHGEATEPLDEAPLAWLNRGTRQGGRSCRTRPALIGAVLGSGLGLALSEAGGNRRWLLPTGAAVGGLVGSLFSSC